MPKLDTQLRLRISSAVKSSLQAWADSIGVTLSSLANSIIKEATERREKEQGK